ncbi:MAG TPA: glycoside hydrolase family 3 N-terminal domain-containing protein [Gemmatimonadaceae bacterium]|nr:glycoside hydrolase family 3 N-terminal domain-containing protein [Gemmatimonadaceae bacterium]
MLATLSPREKVGQLFMRWIPGSYRDTTTKEYAETRRWVTEDSLGGFIISIGSPAELAAKTNALQRLSRVPLLFAADIEFGPGQRLIPGGAVFPPEMGVAATGDTSFSCAHGRVTAEQARAVGIRWVFTPDVDVNVDPANPIVNTRAYSDRASVVSRYAVPFIRCAEAAGMLTTAKHFAAHGAAHVDSHIATPVVMATRAELDRGDFLPFRAAIDAGVSAIMSAHVALPRLSGDSVPASLNPRVLRRIVREEWGFQGVVVTDALWMGGAAKSSGSATDAGALAVRAILAGNDVILDPAEHKVMIAALLRAVDDGTITRARLDSSVRRILVAKAKAGLDGDRYVDERAVVSRVPSAADDSVAALAVRRSLVFARGSAATSALTRLRRGDTLRVLTYLDEGEHPAPGLSPGTTFAAELASLLAPRGVAVAATSWTPRNTPLLADVVRAARGARAVVLAPFVRPLALKGTIGLPPAAEGVYRAALAVKPDAVVVSFGDPYLVRQLPGVRTYLLAWNPWSPEAERAAARALAGGAPAPGQLPVSLEGRMTSASLSYGATRAALQHALLDSITRVLERGVADSAFPGAYAVVGTRDGIVAAHGAGRIDWRADAPRPDARTLWDLASLTKVVGTTSAMMQLVERKRVSLDAPVQRYLPAWKGANKERVTVRQLLTHSSGLPATEKFYKQTRSRDSLLALVYATPLDTLPGARTLYSDLGAILLGEIVEHVSHERLDAYLARHVFTPLGMTDTRFLPVQTGALSPSRARLLARTAPTERDPWRGRLVRGEVHDENAWVMGGVSGHAGLFSTAHDLTRFARALLDGGRLGTTRVFLPQTVAEFTTAADATASSRALGWDTATGANSAGHLMSPVAFGHTGFTGTSLWVDPASGVFVILLTNRVNPARENQRIGAVRVALADAAMAALRPATAAAAPPAAASPTTRAVP